MIELTYSDWEDLSQVEKDVIHAIDEVTIYGEDLDKGLNAFDVFANDDHNRVRDHILEVIHEEKITNEEYNVQRKDGSVFPIIMHLNTFKDPNSESTVLRVVMIDISKRKKAEDELKEYYNKLLKK